MATLQIYVRFRTQDASAHGWLKATACREGRSMAGQILALIRQAEASEILARQAVADTKHYLDHERPAQDPA